MTRWTKPAGLAGKHKQPFFSTAGTPDTGKSAHGIAAVQVLLDHFLDYRPEIKNKQTVSSRSSPKERKSKPLL
jgi:hypothetical protein